MTSPKQRAIGNQPPATVAQLPVVNAVEAVLIAVAALFGAVAELTRAPGINHEIPGAW